MSAENQNGKTPEIHSNGENEIGSPLNTGARHGADHQLKGNEDHKGKEETTDTNTVAPVKPEQDEQTFNGNNLPDANKTQQP